MQILLTDTIKYLANLQQINFNMKIFNSIKFPKFSTYK